MILIGQYDSAFVRRVGIALTLYGMPFEHRPWSVFGDAELIRPYNPLLRVPTLVLDDGDVLIESHTILDHLDHVVGPHRALWPAAEPERHRALRVAALGTGLADLVVSLFYEKRLHEKTSDLLVGRRQGQIRDALAVLEADRVSRHSPHWFGSAISHADIAVTAALRALTEAHPGLADMAAFPALARHAAFHEDLPVFRQVSQPFIAPA